MYSNIQIMALIILVVAAIKILVILIKPKAWANVVNAVWKNPLFTGIICFILSGVVLYYLLQAGITIIQIFAVMLFISLLGGVGVAVYSKEIISIVKNLLKDKKILKKGWFYILIWIVLIIWGFKEFFM